MTSTGLEWCRKTVGRGLRHLAAHETGEFMKWLALHRDASDEEIIAELRAMGTRIVQFSKVAAEARAQLGGDA